MQRREHGLAGDRAACARQYLGVDIDLDDHDDLDDLSHDDQHEHDDEQHEHDDEQHEHDDEQHEHDDEQHVHHHEHEQLDFDLDDDPAAPGWPVRLPAGGSGALGMGGSSAVGHPAARGAR